MKDNAYYREKAREYRERKSEQGYVFLQRWIHHENLEKVDILLKSLEKWTENERLQRENNEKARNKPLSGENGDVIF